MNKDFSVLKWFVFPVVTIALSAVVLYFNVQAFGWDSLPYFIALGSVLIASLVLCYFTGHRRRGVRIAAFAFECVMWIVLIGNAAYSFSAQRDFAIARQAGQARKDTIAEIVKLKSGRAQRDAIGQLGDASAMDAMAIFGKVEWSLRAFMIAELVSSLGGVLFVFGLTVIRAGGRKRHRAAFTGQRTLSHGMADSVRKVIGLAPVSADQPAVSAENSMDQPRSATDRTLKLIPQDTGVRVCGPRGNREYYGHISWDRWERIDGKNIDAIMEEVNRKRPSV